MKGLKFRLGLLGVLGVLAGGMLLVGPANGAPSPAPRASASVRPAASARPATPRPAPRATPRRPGARPGTAARPSARPTVKPERDQMHLSADYMKYDRKAKVAFASGSVVIVQDDTTIHTEEVQFDQGNRISYMNKPVHLVQEKPNEPRTVLDSKRMTVFHREKRVLAEGDTKLVRAKNPASRPTDASNRAKVSNAIKKEDTVITADTLEYWTAKKDARFTGRVIMINGQKKAWGDSCFIDNAKNLITFESNVKLIQLNGNWLIKEGIVKADTPDEARDEAMRERASLTCDRLVIDQNTNDAVATGKVVRVEQKGKVATSRRAVFSDKDHTITLTEEVRIQQANGDWLTAARAVFNTETEVFEAFSEGRTPVRTEFEVPNRPGQPTPTPVPGRVEMDVDVNSQGGGL